MKLGSKVGWLTKPREGWLFRTSNFILHDPKAFNLVFVWGLWFSLFFFSLMLYTTIVFKVDIIVPILIGLLLLTNARNLFKFYKFKKASGDFKWTVSDFMNYKNRKKIKVEKVK